MRHATEILSVMLLCGAACAPEWHDAPADAPDRLAPLRICSHLPSDAGDAVRAVIATWDRALRGWRHVTIATDWCDITLREGSTPEGTLAVTDQLGGQTVTVHPGMREPGVMAHEIGHCLGAQHTATGLMASTWSGQDCPDQMTALQVAAYHHLPLSLLGWCWR